jgi:hypothetical protein
MQQEVFAVEKVDQSNLPEWGSGWTHINPDPNGQARMWQTFTPEQSNITAVEIDILTITPGQGDDILIVEITKDGEILASAEHYVEDGFDGLLRFEFTEAVTVVSGELYELKVRDTGKTRFGWKYASNTYERGSRYVLATERPGTDWFFRIYSMEPRIIYVDDDAAGTNDGSSWEDAYVYLQDALTDANSAEKPVEIRVAQGIYKPDQGANQIPRDRGATFQLINNVTLNGGYAGFGETDPNVRDVDLYEVILSGDLNGDDAPNFSNNSENSYHIIVGSGTDRTAVLDGFSVTAGNANVMRLIDDRLFDSRYSCGGGMFNASGHPTLLNCNFYANSANCFGGGMHNSTSNPKLMNCAFSGNSVTGEEYNSGGGMYNVYGSEPILTNCFFVGNYAYEGSGIGNSWGSNVRVTNCTFTDNWSEGSDSGVIYSWEAIPTITNCILWSNTQPQIVGKPVVTFSNVQGGCPGDGNIDVDPNFVREGYWTKPSPRNPNLSVWIEGDYHLKSEAGRWDPVNESWVTDNVTSPCIDAGDPNSPVGDEPDPNGGRINMGAYGGTAEASKSYTSQLFQTTQGRIRDFRFKAVK